MSEIIFNFVSALFFNKKVTFVSSGTHGAHGTIHTYILYILMCVCAVCVCITQK